MTGISTFIKAVRKSGRGSSEGLKKEIERLKRKKVEGKLDEYQENKLKEMEKDFPTVEKKAKKDIQRKDMEKDVADAPSWEEEFSKMSEEEKAILLGGPTKDAAGVYRNQKKGGRVAYKKAGGRVAPKGCGVAQRGYGKAMKSK